MWIAIISSGKFWYQPFGLVSSNEIYWFLKQWSLHGLFARISKLMTSNRKFETFEWYSRRYLSSWIESSTTKFNKTKKKAPSCSIPKTYHDKGLEHIQKTSLFKQVKVMSWVDHHLFVHTHWPENAKSSTFQSFKLCSSLSPFFLDENLLFLS